jgi:hypothetical protein
MVRRSRVLLGLSKHATLTSRLLDFIEQAHSLGWVLNFVHPPSYRWLSTRVLLFHIEDAYSTGLRVLMRFLNIDLHSAVTIQFLIVGNFSLRCVTILTYQLFWHLVLFPSCLSSLLKQTLGGSGRLILSRIELSNLHVPSTPTMGWWKCINRAIWLGKLKVPIASY